MAVYQSGTKPVIRKRKYVQVVPGEALSFEPHVVKRMLMREAKIPRKAEWFLSIDLNTGTHEHRFEWYEVETNA